MTDRHIETEFHVWAEPTPSGKGFYGRYGAPGSETSTVLEDGGARKVFLHDGDACAAAGVALCGKLNRRTKSRHTNKVIKLTGNEFAAALGRIGISTADFATIYGARNEERVVSWIDGVEDVPHPARLLLILLADPVNLETVRQITAMVSFDARDVDQRGK